MNLMDFRLVDKRQQTTVTCQCMPFESNAAMCTIEPFADTVVTRYEAKSYKITGYEITGYEITGYEITNHEITGNGITRNVSAKTMAS